MSEPLITAPPDGWSTADLDELPESNQRYELTDGAITVSPSPSNLHQWVAHNLGHVLAGQLPDAYTVAFAVEVRFAPQLTRIPDVLVVRSDDPGRHWFSPAEIVVAAEVESRGSHVEDRTTKPALYAQYGIPHYWRIEQEPLRVTVYRSGPTDSYVVGTTSDTLKVTEPFPIDLPLAELLPRWAR
ncbi:MAG: Uma2 family endonuclease [Streptosporangiaceae bacterium]